MHLKTMTIEIASIIQGDTWDSISLRMYGDEAHTGRLIHANPRHANTTVFSAGVKINVPPRPAPSIVDNLPPWRSLA